jgi:sulfate/thiosulfate transport system permease protein
MTPCTTHASPPPVPPGNIIGKTQTLTMFVESAYKEYNTEAAFAAAVLLSMLALLTLVVKGKLEEANGESE